MVWFRLLTGVHAQHVLQVQLADPPAALRQVVAVVQVQRIQQRQLQPCSAGELSPGPVSTGVQIVDWCACPACPPDAALPAAADSPEFPFTLISDYPATPPGACSAFAAGQPR